jgi:hypothetical protein
MDNMKKIALLLIIGLAFILKLSAQKENGTVYIEHDAINKTRAMWAAFVKGDKETFASFFADTVMVGSNGIFEKKPKAYMVSLIDGWKDYENLTIQDEQGSFPDAIEYKEGGLWVQDWLLWTGTHKTTGIKIKVRVHSLYQFNKEGKIVTGMQYYNYSVFNEINKSQKTIESGVIYKYHPYINTIRKLVNAYCAKDKNLWVSFYTPDASFSNLSLKANTSFDLKTRMANAEKNFANYNTIDMVQSGQPICVAYEKETFVVYSWWVLSLTDKNNNKKSGIQVMMSHGFNNDGKVTWESVYVDSKRLE